MFTFQSLVFLNISVYPVGSWIKIVLVRVLLLIQESGTIQTLHYGRLLRRVSLPGRALGVMEDQDGILNAAQ